MSDLSKIKIPEITLEEKDYYLHTAIILYVPQKPSKRVHAYVRANSYLKRQVRAFYYFNFKAA